MNILNVTNFCKTLEGASVVTVPIFSKDLLNFSILAPRIVLPYSRRSTNPLQGAVVPLAPQKCHCSRVVQFHNLNRGNLTYKEKLYTPAVTFEMEEDICLNNENLFSSGCKNTFSYHYYCYC